VEFSIPGAPLHFQAVFISVMGTAAPPYANLTLLLEIAMGVGLLIGALLARLRRFSAARLVPDALD
jgi:hypothetical protein